MTSLLSAYWRQICILTLCYYGGIVQLEVDVMVGFTIRLPEELHEKLRWLAFRERRSQHAVVIEILERALADVETPKEEKK